MANKWINIHDEKPYDDEPVYYYFHNKVFYGFYFKEDVSCLYLMPYGTYSSNIFYGRSGFLSNDVTWWMPREDTEGIIIPEKPCIQ
jgi:hypothetical protein